MKRTKFPIELICSKDELRPAMTGVLIDNGYAVATDGHVLVIMKLADMQMPFLEEFNGKIIKADVFKRINNSKLYVTVENDQIIVDGDIIGSPFIDAAFPNYTCVLPSENGELGIIGVDAENLARIQKAFNCKRLNISFGNRNSRAMSIKPNYPTEYDFQAICMPVFVDPDTKPFILKAPQQLETA